MSIVKEATKTDILEMARKLPWDQRWELIKELSETIPVPPPDGMTREEFRAELDRRWEECESGRMTCSPFEEVIERLRQKNRTDG
jgi:putative addiction module component (TIGR02574 family)